MEQFIIQGKFERDMLHFPPFSPERQVEGILKICIGLKGIILISQKTK